MTVSQGAYNSEWYAQAVSMQKDISYMLTRHQHPVTLSVSGLMPELTLRYYSAVRDRRATAYLCGNG